MLVNEVVANIALELLGHKKGDYHIISPLDHVNHSQSTNDVYPTAVKIASIKLLRELLNETMALQESLQEKEKDFSHIIKTGRTQFQDAVPMTLGQEFSAYAESISRDRWRLYKIEERIRSNTPCCAQRVRFPDVGIGLPKSISISLNIFTKDGGKGTPSLTEKLKPCAWPST